MTGESHSRGEFPAWLLTDPGEGASALARSPLGRPAAFGDEQLEEIGRVVGLQHISGLIDRQAGAKLAAVVMPGGEHRHAFQSFLLQLAPDLGILPVQLVLPPPSNLCELNRSPDDHLMRAANADQTAI